MDTRILIRFLRADNIITQAQADLLPRRTVDPASYPPAPYVKTLLPSMMALQ